MRRPGSTKETGVALEVEIELERMSNHCIDDSSGETVSASVGFLFSVWVFREESGKRRGRCQQ
jgi:hypothetical protein